MKSESEIIIPKKPLFVRHEYAVPFDESILNKTNFEIIKYLKENTILFNKLSDDLIDQLVPLSKIEVFSKGDEILKEDALNGKIFFLMSGAVGIYKGGEHILKLHRKGDIFGEMSLISKKPVSANVKAESKTEVFSIHVSEIGKHTKIDENALRDSLYKLYAVILADKLAMTTYKAIGLERRVKERTADLEINNEKLRIAKEEADRANREKSQFLSNMSHELRTPMHQIISFAQIGIKRINEQKDKILECFHNITSSSDRMMKLVSDLLDLSELESGRMKYHFEENDVFVIMTETLTSLGSQLEEKNISITMVPPTVQTKIICDRHTISKSIQKLLSNSIQYTPKNKNLQISFNSKSLSSDETPDERTTLFLLVSIKDEGLGIPEDELEVIFDKFKQSSKTKTGAGGTGLGLAICQEIIKAHKGKIWAENNPEGGATFSILLPIEKVEV